MIKDSDIKRLKRVKKKIAEGKWSTLNQGMKLLESVTKIESRMRRNKNK